MKTIDIVGDNYFGKWDKECCIREVAEETGMLVDVSESMLEISEGESI